MEMDTKQIDFDNTEKAFAWKSDKELKHAAWLFGMMNYSWLVGFGTSLTPLAFKMKLPIKSLVRKTIFSHFCGGENLEDALAMTEKLQAYHVAATLDYGTEGKESEEDFERTIAAIEKSFRLAKGNPQIHFISLKVTGLARFALLEKMSSDDELSDAEKAESGSLRKKLDRAAAAADDAGIGLFVDAEETWIQIALDNLVRDMMMKWNKQKAVVLNTLQMYRTDRVEFLSHEIETAKQNGFLLGLKLVRGAYMDKERKRANEKNYPSPIAADKTSTDKNFDDAVRLCIQHIDHVNFCIASHNENSNLLGARLSAEKNIPSNHPHLNFSQLLGMSDHISFNLAAQGFRVTKYIPYGPVQDVIPYLMRRAKENSSVSGQMGRELRLLKKEIARRGL